MVAADMTDMWGVYCIRVKTMNLFVERGCIVILSL